MPVSAAVNPVSVRRRPGQPAPGRRGERRSHRVRSGTPENRDHPARTVLVRAPDPDAARYLPGRPGQHHGPRAVPGRLAVRGGPVSTSRNRAQPVPRPLAWPAQLSEAIDAGLASCWPAGLRLAAWRRDLVQLVYQVTEVPCAERRAGAVAGNQARRQRGPPAARCWRKDHPTPAPARPAPGPRRRRRPRAAHLRCSRQVPGHRHRRVVSLDPQPQPLRKGIGELAAPAVLTPCGPHALVEIDVVCRSPVEPEVVQRVRRPARGLNWLPGTSAPTWPGPAPAMGEPRWAGRGVCAVRIRPKPAASVGRESITPGQPVYAR